ncbi:hypothetical protein BURKHO8Y_30272 [Burkholderia sp. 8Y]|nr:hypothetical protein BURKHO8Y_30272 [Burkholderia sp. 8Y]
MNVPVEHAVFGMGNAKRTGVSWPEARWQTRLKPRIPRQNLLSRNCNTTGGEAPSHSNVLLRDRR